ncbi:MAG: hypothetical protein WCF84_23685 [Anaerolineae bacterium]
MLNKYLTPFLMLLFLALALALPFALNALGADTWGVGFMFAFFVGIVQLVIELIWERRAAWVKSEYGKVIADYDDLVNKAIDSDRLTFESGKAVIEQTMQAAEEDRKKAIQTTEEAVEQGHQAAEIAHQAINKKVELERRLADLEAKSAAWQRNPKGGRPQDPLNKWAIDEIQEHKRDRSEVFVEYWQKRKKRGDNPERLSDRKDLWKKNGYCSA